MYEYLEPYLGYIIFGTHLYLIVGIAVAARTGKGDSDFTESTLADNVTFSFFSGLFWFPVVIVSFFQQKKSKTNIFDIKDEFVDKHF